MRFNEVYQSIKEKFDDPEVEAAWGDIVPQLSEPVTYNCYTVMVSPGAYDLYKRWAVKARSIEEAQDKVHDEALKDWKDSWAENAESARDDYNEDVDPDDPPENEFIEKFPVDQDDIAMVGTGEDTVVVVTTRKFKSSKQLEDYLDTVFEGNN